MTPSSPPIETVDTEYRYDHFTVKLLVEDLRFHDGALAPGDVLALEEMPDSDGSAIRLVGTGRPLLLVTGSMTCPMTASAMPQVLALHREFGDRVDFALLSAREAHPGENHPQPKSDADVRERASELRDFYGVPFAVLVDDVNGSLHRRLDSKPNAAFLFDRAGILVFRALWSSDERAVRAGLEAVANAQTPARSESTAMLHPMVRALGHIDEVVRRGGPSAQRDLRRSALPMAVAGRLARLLRRRRRSAAV
jgi:hypothetical protein